MKNTTIFVKNNIMELFLFSVVFLIVSIIAKAQCEYDIANAFYNNTLYFKIYEDNDYSVTIVKHPYPVGVIYMIETETEIYNTSYLLGLNNENIYALVSEIKEEKKYSDNEF